MILLAVDIVVKPNDNDKTFEPKSQHLTYSEVERITDNFQKVLGRGASAIVYPGHLSNGTEVAVKKLLSSFLGSKQFKTEVNFSMLIFKLFLILTRYSELPIIRQNKKKINFNVVGVDWSDRLSF